MKKIAVLLSVVSLVLLASCGKKEEVKVETTNTSTVSTSNVEEMKVEENTTGTEVMMEVESEVMTENNTGTSM